jgi:hypothetical protein
VLEYLRAAGFDEVVPVVEVRPQIAGTVVQHAWFQLFLRILAGNT